MKRNKTLSLSIIAAAVVLAALVFSCKKDPQPVMERFDLSREDITVGTTSASIAATYTYSGTIDEIKVCVSEDGVHPREFVADTNGKNFTVEMSGLRPATEYQYYYSVDYGFSKPFTTEAKTFTTLSELPTVRTVDVISIDSTTVRVNCETVSDGGVEITERGICWNTYGNPNYDDEKVAYSEAGTGEYSCRIGGLSPYSNYHVKAYAINGSGISYGEEIVFSTLSTGYTITVSSNPENGGMVTGGGVYYEGQNCIVVAQANDGYYFSYWSEDEIQVSSEAVFSFVVTGNRNLVAHFTQQLPDHYAINVSSNNDEGGSVVGGGLFQFGQSCTIMATVREGYSFVNWTEDGVEVSADAIYTFEVTQNRNLVANFFINYTITVFSDPESGGVITGGGVYYEGQLCTVTAVANTSFNFVNWSENGCIISNEATYGFIVNCNKTLTAVFEGNAPIGAINGLFSVSTNRQIWFSQGNLQYQASTSTWRFAEDQWGYVGGVDSLASIEYGNVYNNGSKCDNSLISSIYEGWIDLFGWGTSGWDNGNDCYHPWDSNVEGLQYGPLGQFDLTGDFALSDWGMFNTITNGGNQMGIWRTLTQEEWDYLFNIRTTSSGIRFAKAKVGNVKGVVLLPDSWNSSFCSLCDTNSGSASYDSNAISYIEWSEFERNGAVFLPAAGWRFGTIYRNSGNLSVWGDYWSSSSSSDHEAYDPYFTNFEFHVDRADSRAKGHSVRLVQDYNR